MLETLKAFIKYKHLIWGLAKNDIKSRYLGSVLGSMWIFLMPLVNLAIMWFAFEHGLKSGERNGYPFLLWLITGLFPWTFFSDAILTSTNSIVEKSFLVKKVVFNVELLPLIKIVASTVLFLFLSFVMIVVFFLYGVNPNVYWLQLPYYFICLFCLICSLSWFTSSIVVFYRDLGQIVAVAIQVGFWVTPIFWAPEMLPSQFRFVTFLNPVTYVVSGYRSCFFEHAWFWETPAQLFLFWGVVMISAIAGLNVFKRLRPHFADVL